MHSTNEAESLTLTEATVADYVRFFFYFLRADEGAFVLIESSEEVASREDTDDPTKEQGDDGVLTLQAAQSEAHPLLMRGLDAEGRWLLDAAVAYGGCLFTMTAAVEASGAIEMIDDNPVGLLYRACGARGSVPQDKRTNR